MKITYRHHIAALLAVGFATTALAQDVIVTPRSAQQAQVERISKRLDSLLDTCRCVTPSNISGIAQVRFEADSAGRPVNVRLYNSTENRAVNHAAQFVVKRLRGIDALLATAPGKTTVQANIVVARNATEMTALTDRLTAMERARIAREGRDGPVLALATLPEVTLP